MRLILAIASTVAVLALPCAATAAPAKKTVVVKHVVGPDGTVHDETSVGLAPDPALKTLVDECSGRKFEAVGVVGEGEQKRSTKIKLCGKPGETDAEWLATLQDARSRISGSALPAEIKAQIVAQLDTAIGRPDTAGVGR